MTEESYGKWGRGLFLGKEAFWRSTVFSVACISVAYSFVAYCLVGGVRFWGFLVNHCRGHRVVGGFEHEGQDSFRYHGAREPDRLLLAGWEVSRFGQSLVSALGWARQQGKDNHIIGN